MSALLIGIILTGCGDGYEEGKLPIVRFTTIQVTDTSATLWLDIVDKGTKDYGSTGGMYVIWSEQPFSWNQSSEVSDLLAQEIDEDSYQITLDSLNPTTTYYASTYYEHREFIGGGGDFVVSSGRENFSFTTLPN